MHIFKKSKRRAVRYGIIATNLALLAAIGVFVVSDYTKATGSDESKLRPAVGDIAEEPVNPLDKLSSVDVAVHVARLAKLDEATSVVNKADTVNASQAVTLADDYVISKPQVVSAGLKSKSDITTYTTKPGDTISSVADKFGVTTNTIRFSNDLSSEVIAPGTTLLISPVNGIVYRVKAGDTPASLASRFRANLEQLIAFNDAELTRKFKVGELIVIPDGVEPSQVGFAYSLGFTAPVYGGGGYDYGYCTYWASLRRAQVGNPIPSNLGNASSWVALASSSGLPTNNIPRQYAVISTGEGGYYGHVGFVESVNPDGSVVISEMNLVGWNVKSTRKFSASQARNYTYIY